MIRVATLALAAIAICLALPTTAAAQGAKTKDSASSSTGTAQKDSEPRVEGDYAGVNLDDSAKERRKRRRKWRRRGNPLWWLGYSPKEDGSAVVFLELGKQPVYETSLTGTVAEVLLEDVRYTSRNIRRFLDTSYFDGALKRIELRRLKRKGKKRKKGLLLRLTFKNQASVQNISPSIQPIDGDGVYLVIDVGAPQVSSGESESDE